MPEPLPVGARVRLRAAYVAMTVEGPDWYVLIPAQGQQFAAGAVGTLEDLAEVETEPTGRVRFPSGLLANIPLAELELVGG